MTRTHNVVSFEDVKEGRTLPKVRLNTDLQPERVFEWVMEGFMYQKGWEGRVIEIEPTANHVDCLPVLFDDFEHPVWIHKQYLDEVY